MKLGIIGLGRMGNAIAHRALLAGYCVLGYDPNIKTQEEMQKSGIQIYESPEAMSKEADIIWLMVPAGKVVDQTLAHISGSLERGKIIIDGGNSHFTDSVRRAKELAVRGIHYLD
jgi:6-phosphogluconate dehydrogenase